MTTEFIITGLIGASPGSVGILPILFTTSMPVHKTLTRESNRPYGN